MSSRSTRNDGPRSAGDATDASSLPRTTAEVSHTAAEAVSSPATTAEVDSEELIQRPGAVSALHYNYISDDVIFNWAASHDLDVDENMERDLVIAMLVSANVAPPTMSVSSDSSTSVSSTASVVSSSSRASSSQGAALSSPSPVDLAHSSVSTKTRARKKGSKRGGKGARSRREEARAAARADEQKDRDRDVMMSVASVSETSVSMDTSSTSAPSSTLSPSLIPTATPASVSLVSASSVATFSSATTASSSSSSASSAPFSVPRLPPSHPVSSTSRLAESFHASGDRMDARAALANDLQITISTDADPDPLPPGYFQSELKFRDGTPISTHSAPSSSSSARSSSSSSFNPTSDPAVVFASLSSSSLASASTSSASLAPPLSRRIPGSSLTSSHDSFSASGLQSTLTQSTLAPLPPHVPLSQQAEIMRLNFLEAKALAEQKEKEFLEQRTQDLAAQLARVNRNAAYTSLSARFSNLSSPYAPARVRSPTFRSMVRQGVVSRSAVSNISLPPPPSASLASLSSSASATSAPTLSISTGSSGRTVSVSSSSTTSSSRSTTLSTSQSTATLSTPQSTREVRMREREEEDEKVVSTHVTIPSHTPPPRSSSPYSPPPLAEDREEGEISEGEDDRDSQHEWQMSDGEEDDDRKHESEWGIDEGYESDHSTHTSPRTAAAQALQSLVYAAPPLPSRSSVVARPHLSETLSGVRPSSASSSRSARTHLSASTSSSSSSSLSTVHSTSSVASSSSGSIGANFSDLIPPPQVPEVHIDDRVRTLIPASLGELNPLTKTERKALLDQIPLLHSVPPPMHAISGLLRARPQEMSMWERSVFRRVTQRLPMLQRKGLDALAANYSALNELYAGNIARAVHFCRLAIRLALEIPLSAVAEQRETTMSFFGVDTRVLRNIQKPEKCFTSVEEIQKKQQQVQQQQSVRPRSHKRARLDLSFSSSSASSAQPSSLFRGGGRVRSRGPAYTHQTRYSNGPQASTQAVFRGEGGSNFNNYPNSRNNNSNSGRGRNTRNSSNSGGRRGRGGRSFRGRGGRKGRGPF